MRITGRMFWVRTCLLILVALLMMNCNIDLTVEVVPEIQTEEEVAETETETETEFTYYNLGRSGRDGYPPIVIISIDTHSIDWSGSSIELDHLRLFESVKRPPQIFGSNQGPLNISLSSAFPVALRFQPPSDTAFNRLDLAGGYAASSTEISLSLKNNGQSRKLLLPDGLLFSLAEDTTPWQAEKHHYYVLSLPLAAWMNTYDPVDVRQAVLYHDLNANGRLDKDEESNINVAGRQVTEDDSLCDADCDVRSACIELAQGLCPDDDPLQMLWPICIDAHLFWCVTPPASECCAGSGRVPLPMGNCVADYECTDFNDGDIDIEDWDRIDGDGDETVEGDISIEAKPDGDIVDTDFEYDQINDIELDY